MATITQAGDYRWHHRVASRRLNPLLRKFGLAFWFQMEIRGPSLEEAMMGVTVARPPAPIKMRLGRVSRWS